MPEKLTVTVAVLTFNRNDDLCNCLDSLAKQTCPDFEILIVNGGDKKGVTEVTDRFKQLRIRVVNQERKGIIEARNLGWRHSSSDIVCLIDDDLVVSPSWLGNIRDTFLSDDSIGGVSGPTIIPPDIRKNRDLTSLLEGAGGIKKVLLSPFMGIYKKVVLEDKMYVVGKILPSGAFTPGSNYEKCLELPGLVDVDYLEACHMCFRRFLFERAGGFNDAYTGTGEWNEPEFAFKVKGMGYRLVFNPKAVTEHHLSQGGVFTARTNAYERSRNFIYFYFRNMKPIGLNKFFRFATNLLYINAYWCYKFFQTANPDWLKGITGTAVGLAKELLSWK